MKNGLYLCKVKGLKFCDYAILRYNEYGWWRYYRYAAYDNVEGWVDNDLEIVEIMQMIKEDCDA